MNKKLLILMPILLIICFSPITNVLSTEEIDKTDDLGIFTYYQWFDGLSGFLVVSTTSINNSAIKVADVSVYALCMNESQIFRLRIYDSDVGLFIEPNNETGIGEKERRFTVWPSMDTESLLWTAYVTDMSAETIYARISLLYTYDKDETERTNISVIGLGLALITIAVIFNIKKKT